MALARMVGANARSGGIDTKDQFAQRAMLILDEGSECKCAWLAIQFSRSA